MQGFSVGIDVGKYFLGVAAQRETYGHTSPPKFDAVGQVIPYSGESVNDVLSDTPWKWSGFPGSGNIKIGDDIEIKLGASFYFGAEVTVNLSEAMRRIKTF